MHYNAIYFKSILQSLIKTMHEIRAPSSPKFPRSIKYQLPYRTTGIRKRKLPYLLQLLMNNGLIAIFLLLKINIALAQQIEKNRMEIVSQIPHSDVITSVAYSNNGKYALSGSNDGDVKLWNTTNGLLIRTLKGHKSRITSIQFSNDDTRALTGARDLTARVWNLATGQAERVFQVHSQRKHADEEKKFCDITAKFSPSDKYVLAGGLEGSVRLWRLRDGARIFSIARPKSFLHHELRSFRARHYCGYSLSFPRGESNFTTIGKTTIKVRHGTTGILIYSFKHNLRSPRAVRFSPDGTLYAAMKDGGRIVDVYDVENRKLVRTIERAPKTNERLVRPKIVFSPDATRIMIGNEVWDIKTRTLSSAVSIGAGVVHAATFSSDGRQLLVAVGFGSFIKQKLITIDAATGALLRRLGGDVRWPSAMHLAPNSSFIAAGDIGVGDTAKGSIGVWDLHSGRLSYVLPNGNLSVTSIDISQDSKLIASTGIQLADFLKTESDTAISVWDTDSKKRIYELGRPGILVGHVAFSPDGKFIAVVSDSYDEVALWHVAMKKVVRKFRTNNPISSLVFTPNSKFLATTSVVGLPSVNGIEKVFRNINMWSVSTSTAFKQFGVAGESFTSAAFSNNGDLLISGSRDGNIKIWNTKTNKLLHEIRINNGSIKSISVSKNDRFLLSADDASVALWNLRTLRLTRKIDNLRWKITRVEFSNDGKFTVLGGRDGRIRIMDSRISKERAWMLRSGSNRWITMAEDRFFTSSGGSDDLIAIVRGMVSVKTSQLYQSLFNPDLVRQSLAGDPDDEVARAMKVINLDKVLDSEPAPEVSISSPAVATAARSDVIAVEARIADKGKGVGRVEWRVNGITAAVLSKPANDGPTHVIKRELALDPGKNVIEVVAYNGSNLLASLPARTTVTFNGSTASENPKVHVLAIGINDYVDKGWTPKWVTEKFGKLKLAVKDAAVVAATLKKAAASLPRHDVGHVITLLDQEATRTNIEKTIDVMARDIHPRDTFIFFAAAHGTSENGRFYLIPQDYQSGSKALQQKAIGQEQLQNWFANRIKAKKAIILLDTCESGALVAGHLRSRLDQAASEAGVGRLHEATGRPVLTAAALGEAAIDGVEGWDGERHGVFTSALLDALRRGDTNGNERIELSELVSHVQRQVPKLAKKAIADAKANKDQLETRAITAVPGKQEARYGSRGEDFAIAGIVR